MPALGKPVVKALPTAPTATNTPDPNANDSIKIGIAALGKPNTNAIIGESNTSGNATVNQVDNRRTAA
jgi:hypothetical protein